ncbi:DUF1499 domain-containing protein [Aliiroseovarius sp. F20344]|uniref:DUF1499 domain-containing protein n=1 Tax=Aliiroseovarius sp. F20344 TaxID=2926414 RepID=UPI001FF34CA5|nr:DUF1499 domain-containing protein [Aliiroseovarius sp. F20344]MCK0143852.1 DUF1499 domain-containing protein [Aliiroseovarius sp. F20344]
MKLIIALLGVIALLLAAFAVYARLKPIDRTRFHATPGPNEVGVHDLKGGVKQVVPLADLPEDAVPQLLELVRQSDGTTEVPADEGYSFVTRSRLFGFPDVTRIWVAENNLHIHAHLVIGSSDVGVNGRRVGQWIELLFAAP